MLSSSPPASNATRARGSVRNCFAASRTRQASTCEHKWPSTTTRPRRHMHKRRTPIGRRFPLDQLEAIQPAVEVIGDSADLAALHARKGWCQWAIGDFREGVQSLDLALEHAQTSGRDEELGFTLMTRQWCEMALGHTEQSLATGHAAIAAATHHFDLQSTVRAHCGVCLSNTYLGSLGPCGRCRIGGDGNRRGLRRQRCAVVRHDDRCLAARNSR